MVELDLLRAVSDKPARIVRLAKTLKMTPQHVGREYQRLADSGLVEIKSDRRDKRAKLVFITESGLANIANEHI